MSFKTQVILSFKGESNYNYFLKDGQHVDISDDEDVDPKEYRKMLKNQNASMFKLQNYRDQKVGFILTKI